MVRLTRAQQQERTRASVLAAARTEFTEHGYGPAKVDRIAERAELTRGAVYSNFPSKRALYLAVLIDLVENAAAGAPSTPPRSPVDALGGFARAWLERLPLADDTTSGGRLRLRSLDGVLDDGHGREVLAQIVRLETLLLAIALESCEPARAEPVRRVRLAALVLTLLDGASRLAETAPGSIDPFDVARACQHLAGIDLADAWAPPHLPYVAPARPCRDTWDPPDGLADRISGNPVHLGADGLVTVLGAGRLGAAEEAVRSAPSGEQVTVVVVVRDPAETGRLVRLRIADLTGCLRRVFPTAALPPLRLLLDEHGTVAAALGIPVPDDEADDETEAAVRVRDGAIVARAHGRGAAHAAATAHAPNTTQPRKTRR
ncbi:TetR/AcrR family transcriptional regulator [Actinophytocola gossypii]|uniref:TetR/AcrR family transcriptional regulator n=1 Tax=Actinophytocola gossypii TaxID=2812003 RepID=A0ABT2JG92_9PSEU|nr:TetR/AcrR family transcriptional regulator [Actinophytocola gossypii]MCT2586450.1 TetR/AcrR family transcriptional regulator [Actinophytocola gossypii]